MKLGWFKKTPSEPARHDPQSGVTQYGPPDVAPPDLKKFDPALGVTTAPGEEYQVKKPIRITRHEMAPMYLSAGDSIAGTFEELAYGAVVRKTQLPVCTVMQSMKIDSAVRIEVIDEFDMDCGIGFIWGQKKV